MDAVKVKDKTPIQDDEKKKEKTVKSVEATKPVVKSNENETAKDKLTATGDKESDKTTKILSEQVIKKEEPEPAKEETTKSFDSKKTGSSGIKLLLKFSFLIKLANSFSQKILLI